ncbi:hemolysin [soil metagenome]
MTERSEPLRLDVALVRRGLARSRDVATEAIRAGMVQVDGRTVVKAAHRVDDGAHLTRLDEVEPWVGRGAHKILAAIDRWVPHGLRLKHTYCIDIGASTGGFTQVLLHHGASHVDAIDVGTGQLAPTLAVDPRVSDMSNTHVLLLARDDITAADLIVMDVSFISAATVLAHVASWCTAHGSIVVLVKPQFEVGRESLGRGGIVRSPEHRRAAVRAVMDTAYQCGLAVRDAMVSPITGSHGNMEYLLWLSPLRPGMMDRPAAYALADTMDL